MPRGKTHDRITFITALIWTGLFLLSWLLFFSRHSWDRLLCFSIFLLFYLFGSLFLSPDLDMEHTDPYRRWQRIGCGWLWMPYAYLVDHRSSWSHCPFRGCLLRLLTLVVALVLFIGGAVWGLHHFGLYGDTDYLKAWGDVLENIRDALWAHPTYLLFALLGLYLSGLVHILSDVLASRWRELLRSGRRSPRRRRRR